MTSEQDETQRGLILYDESSMTLHLKVRFKSDPVPRGDLLFILVENLNALIYTFFNTRPEIRIPCSHCLRLLESNESGDFTPCLFTLEECLIALCSPSQSLVCTTTTTASINTSSDNSSAVGSTTASSNPIKKLTVKLKQLKRRHFSSAASESKNPIPNPQEASKSEVKTTVTLREVAPDMTFAFHTNELSPAFTIFDYSQITLEEKVAEGGYAILHRGHVNAPGMDPKQIYAIKVLRDQDGGEADLLTNSFRELQHEVFMMASLRHENIVELKGLCLKPLALVMDFFPLGSLDKHLRSNSSKESNRNVKTLSWSLRLRIAADICKGLSVYLEFSPFSLFLA